MRFNRFGAEPKTHEGGPSTRISHYDQLRRSVMACMLFEDTFYEDGVAIADRIAELCMHVKPQEIIDLALEAHQKYLLRHTPLWLLVHAMKRKAPGIKEAVIKLCSRPDQMTELLALYWKSGKTPLANALKKGLKQAFMNFSHYQLAKYNRDEPIKLRDIMFLCHPVPANEQMAAIYKAIANKESISTGDTWENKLSAGADKKQTFQELLEQGKLGKLALLRNLRNMKDAGVDKTLVKQRLLENPKPMLPFQFIAAGKACPDWEDVVDEAMVLSASKKPKLLGNTLLLVDVSGSMDSPISGKTRSYMKDGVQVTVNPMMRMEAACAFAILLREICENVEIFTFSNNLAKVPPRHGMALRDAIVSSQPHSGTSLGACISVFNQNNALVSCHRILILTDEQSCDAIPRVPVKKCYVLNVAAYQNGIQNNGQWLTISGFAEASIDYIREIEQETEKKDESSNATVTGDSDSLCVEDDAE